MVNISDRLDEELADFKQAKEQAFGVFMGDKNTDVTMSDGQVIPSLSKAVNIVADKEK